MSSPQDCLDKLRQLAAVSSGEPRRAAAKIVSDFAGSASKGDVSQLRVRLENTLLAGKWTIVPVAFSTSTAAGLPCWRVRVRRLEGAAHRPSRLDTGLARGRPRNGAWPTEGAGLNLTRKGRPARAERR
jgi:hypothetical protein